jgi:glycosyltransferase involved in cell wall biosynthesis
MATRTPIILGVKGETEEIIRKANAGIPIKPENPDELVQAALQLKSQPQLCHRMGASGYRHVYAHFDRRTLARRYASLLAQTCGEAEAVDTPEPQLAEV